jgi:hypothetical protein
MHSSKLAILLVLVLLTQPVVSLAMSSAVSDIGKTESDVSTEQGTNRHGIEGNLGVTLKNSNHHDSVSDISVKSWASSRYLDGPACGEEYWAAAPVDPSSDPLAWHEFTFIDLEQIRTTVSNPYLAPIFRPPRLIQPTGHSEIEINTSTR